MAMDPKKLNAIADAAVGLSKRFDALCASRMDAEEKSKPSGGYNSEAVNKEIAKDPRIKGKEASAIHRLLKGRHDAEGDKKAPKEGDLEGNLVELKGKLRDAITQGHENIVGNIRKDIKDLEERIEAKSEVGLGEGSATQ